MSSLYNFSWFLVLLEFCGPGLILSRGEKFTLVWEVWAGKYHMYEGYLVVVGLFFFFFLKREVCLQIQCLQHPYNGVGIFTAVFMLIKFIAQFEKM